MDEDCVFAADLVPELTYRLEEWQRLDIADGPSDLDDDHVAFWREALHRAFDLVGDVRNHLDGRAEVFPAALLGDYAQVDASGGDIVGLGQRAVYESLVVSEVEVCLRAVVRHEYFSVLEGRHRAWIYVQVRVELHDRHAHAALDQKSSQ